VFWLGRLLARYSHGKRGNFKPQGEKGLPGSLEEVRKRDVKKMLAEKEGKKDKARKAQVARAQGGKNKEGKDRKEEGRDSSGLPYPFCKALYDYDESRTCFDCR